MMLMSDHKVQHSRRIKTTKNTQEIFIYSHDMSHRNVANYSRFFIYACVFLGRLFHTCIFAFVVTVVVM